MLFATSFVTRLETFLSAIFYSINLRMVHLLFFSSFEVSNMLVVLYKFKRIKIYINGSQLKYCILPSMRPAEMENKTSYFFMFESAMGSNT